MKDWNATTLNQRNEADQEGILGYGTTRYKERSLAALGALAGAPIIHEPHQGLIGGGLMLLIPALIAQGLMKCKEVYSYGTNYYYSLESIILTLAFMALARIKNPEQIKNCKQGEMGRLLGLDRIPETKCVRGRINLLSQQEKSWDLNTLLIRDWYPEGDPMEAPEDGLFLYMDGHQRIYHGYKANLTSKFISRQKLCLSATTEYWVNDQEGLPILMVMGELTEKLQHAIEDYILPKLVQSGIVKDLDPDFLPAIPQCTFVFDREAFALDFFQRLWDNHRIAILTYRKNVKDSWNELLFQSTEVQLLHHKITMLLHEQPIALKEHTYREVRRLTSSGHQTAVLTTHPTLSIQKIAANMFNRWTQENFFRYMMADYDFDKIVEYGIEEIDLERKIVNPEYKTINYKLKKLREKKSRKQAQYLTMIQKIIDQPLDQTQKHTEKQAKKLEEIQAMEQQEALLIAQRKNCPPKIKLKEMPPASRYNKLKTESKLFMNIIKMICYRAESSVAQILNEKLNRGADEKRMLVKQIIENPIDLQPDHVNKTLTITLHSLSANRFNEALFHLIDILNESHTIFPDTDLRLIFKSSAS